MRWKIRTTIIAYNIIDKILHIMLINIVNAYQKLQHLKSALDNKISFSSFSVKLRLLKFQKYYYIYIPEQLKSTWNIKFLAYHLVLNCLDIKFQTISSNSIQFNNFSGWIIMQTHFSNSKMKFLINFL